MSETSKKRGFPKFSKWGKFLKLRRSKKKENKTICVQEEKFDHEEVNKIKLDQETTALIVEKTTEDNVLELKEDTENPEEVLVSQTCSLKDQKEAVKVDLCQKFEVNTKVNGDGSNYVLKKESESNGVAVSGENDPKYDRKDKDLLLADNVNSSPGQSKGLNSLDFQELVSAVTVHTPPPTQSEKQDLKAVNDEKDEELAFPIINTPSPKVKRADNGKDELLSTRKATNKNDIDEDDFVIAPDSTPSQKKLDKKDRALTVKKIRSIIATPYKRLKREGSLLDGQTYRYIEIQSLVNAFQSMHPCIGSMIACNEKGLQYGKSSVLRIECRECYTKTSISYPWIAKVMTEEKELLEKLQERRSLAEFLLQRSEKLNKSIGGLQKLIRKIRAEIRFLDSLQTQQVPIKASHVQSTNLAHLQGVVKATEQAGGVTAVFRTFNFSPSHSSTEEGVSDSCIVDVVANNGSDWIKVIARNPKSLHKIWQGEGQFGDKNLVDQAKDFVKCSKSHTVHFQNPMVTFLFCSGVTESLAKCLTELGVNVQGDILVDPESECASLTPITAAAAVSPTVTSPCMQLERKICPRNENSINHVNLDVSTMIAFVSAVTNGGAMFIFKDSILNSQAEKERKKSLLPVLTEYFKGKELLACSSAISDFKKIVDIIGGPNEKRRASQLLDQIKNVPDKPSERALKLKDSASIKTRSKIIFGTGDSLKATTATANSSFVRAACGQGVDFSVFLHDSRALTESKESQAVPFTPS